MRLIRFQKTFLFLIMFVVLLVVGCSKDVMDEIDVMIKSSFGNYTKDNPLRIMVMPFKPALDFDSESVIGIIAWNGAIRGVEDAAYFSDGKIVYEGRVEPDEYLNVLRTDDFWDDMSSGNKDIKAILKIAATDYGVNGIIYGLYTGSEAKLKLTVYFYSKRDEIVLKQRTYTESSISVLRAFVKAIQDDKKLTTAQTNMVLMIKEKMQVVTVKLLRKYLEGL